MAIIIDQVTGGGGGSSTTAPAWNDWFSNQETGDYIVAVVGVDNTGAVTIPGTWSRFEGSAPSAVSGIQGEFFYIKHTGTDIVEPTISGPSDDWAMTAVLVRGADETTFVDAYVITDQTSSTRNPSFPSVTTTTDNCLVLHFAVADGNLPFQDNWMGDCFPLEAALENPLATNSTITVTGGYNLKATAGSTGVINLQQSLNDGGRYATICIRNKTGGDISSGVVPSATNPITELVNAVPSNPTLVDINTIRATFAGVSTYASSSLGVFNRPTYTFNESQVGGAARELKYDPSINSGWHGFYIAVSAADFTGKRLLVASNGLANAVRGDTADGTCFYFEDGVGNWVLWSAINLLNVNNFLITLTDITAELFVDSSGTMDWSDVVRIGAVVNTTGNTITRGMNTALIALIDMSQRHSIVGGSAGNPCSLRAASSIAYRGPLGVSSDIQGPLSNVLSYGFNVGDGGTTKTYFRAVGQNAYYPKENEFGRINLTSGDISININIGSDDTFDMSGAALFATVESPQKLTFDPSTATDGTYATAAVTDYFDWTCKTGIPIEEARVSHAAQIDAKGAQWNNCRISETRAGASEAAIGFDENGSCDGTIINVTDTDAGYHIELGVLVDAFTLTDVTFTGTPGVNKIHVLKTTGTVTFTISGSTSLSVSDITTEGAAIDILESSASVSGTGMPTTGTARLQIINDTAASASAWQATTAYSAGDKVLRTTGVGSESTAGLYFVVTTAGTTGGTEPTWDTVVDNTTADGSAVWTCYAILFYDADPGAATYAATYTDGQEIIAGDSITIRFAILNGSTSFSRFETTLITQTSGFSFAVSAVNDDVYALNAEDGLSTPITDIFTADYQAGRIIADSDADLDWTYPRMYAFYCGELTNSTGMYRLWGGVTAIDAGTYRNNTAIASIFIASTNGFTKQSDSDTSRFFRDDGQNPFLEPPEVAFGTAGNWKVPVYLQNLPGASVLSAGESAQLAATAKEATLTDIKGAGWSTETLKDIRDNVGADVNIVEVNGVAVTDIEDFKADVNGVAAASELATVKSNQAIMNDNIKKGSTYPVISGPDTA